MAQVLQLAHFVEHNRMAEMQIRRSRIESKFDSERLSSLL